MKRRKSPEGYKKRVMHYGTARTEGYKDIDIDKLKELYFEKEWSIMLIAEYFFVTHPTILNRIKEHNLPRRRKGNRNYESEQGQTKVYG